MENISLDILTQKEKEIFVTKKLTKYFLDFFKNKKFKLKGNDKQIGKIVGFNFRYNDKDKLSYISSVHFKPDIKEEGKLEVFDWITFSDLIPVTRKYVKADINQEMLKNKDFDYDLARTYISHPTVESLERKKEKLKEKDIYVYMINEIEKDLYPNSLDVIYVTDKKNFDDIEYLMEFPTKLINNIEEVRDTVFKKPSYKETTKMYNKYSKEFLENLSKKQNRYKNINFSPSF